MGETLSDIGEIEILKRLEKFMDLGQIEDDTALLPSSSKDLLINTDVLVENVHFSEQTASPKDIGWKAIASNLSDLASSGANGHSDITVALVAPPTTTWSWVEGVYEGMETALNIFGGRLIGGDCSKGKEKILSITAISQLGPFRLHRGNAVAGDYLVTTGPHGLSRLGLELLTSKSPNNREKISSSLESEAINHHQRPYPPIEAIKKLELCKPMLLPSRVAGTDSSDGLIRAIQGICRSSNCQAILNKNNLPVHPDWPKGKKWENWCLFGGEDYEIILSLPPKWAEAWLKAIPSGRKIGFIKTGKPKVTWDDGKEIINSNQQSFEHF